MKTTTTLNLYLPDQENNIVRFRNCDAELEDIWKVYHHTREAALEALRDWIQKNIEEIWVQAFLGEWESRDYNYQVQNHEVNIIGNSSVCVAANIYKQLRPKPKTIIAIVDGKQFTRTETSDVSEPFEFYKHGSFLVYVYEHSFEVAKEKDIVTFIELKMAADLLEQASGEYSNHGCNDLDLTKYMPEADAIEYNKLLLEDPNVGVHSYDWLVMRHLANKLRKLADK